MHRMKHALRDANQEHNFEALRGVDSYFRG